MKCAFRSFVLAAALILAAISPLAARETISLDGTWRFAVDEQSIGEANGWFASGFVFDVKAPEGSSEQADGTIVVPGIWDNQGYGGETDKLKHHYVGLGWYKRSFSVPAEWSGNDIILTLGGISRYAKVWVNGQSAGDELVGQVASFSLDVTKRIKFGEENDITVRVDSKQRWEIDAILGAASLNDYMEIEWGGLWGHVTLEARPKERIDDIYLMTNLAESTCTASAEAKNLKTATSAKIEIFDAQGNKVAENSAPVTANAPSVSVAGKIENPNLWTPDTPYLYTVKLLLMAGDKTLDMLESRYGMRELATDGTKLLLNGKPFFLRGYGDDHIYPYEFSMPTDKAMYLARMKVIKSFGFNHCRHHSTILPHEFYEACDEVGIMPTGEFPIGYPQQLPGNILWSQKVPAGTPIEPALDTYRERFAQVVKEYRNHPCILTWVMGNELWTGMSINHDFKKIAKTLDPQRFFCDTDGDCLGYFQQDTVTTNQRYWNPADSSETTVPGKDRDTLDLFFVLYNEWETPLTLEKFSFRGFKKPAISHEAGNFITFSRPDQVKLFDDGLFEGNPALAGRSETDKDKPLESDYRPFWMADGAKKLVELGLDNEAEDWAKASEEMYYIHHKYNVEGIRLNPEMCGYHWWLIQDYWTTSNGLVDLFFRPKSIQPERVRLFNAPLVLLQNGLERTYRSGDVGTVELLVSNFTDSPVSGTLRYTVTLAGGSLEGSAAVDRVASGEVQKIAAPSETVPDVYRPEKMKLSVSLVDKSGKTIQRNEWSAMIYPREQKMGAVNGKTVFASDDIIMLFPEAGFKPIPTDSVLPTDAVYAVSFIEARIADAIEKGAGCVLLGESLNFPSQSVQYQQTWWKGGDSDSTNHVGTFVYPTEIMKELESENWCEPYWFDLLNGAVKYYLEQLPSRPTVHIRALPSLVRVQDTAILFDVAIGEGTLVVSGLNHMGAKGRPENCAAVYAMIRRAASDNKPSVTWPLRSIAPIESVPDGTTLGYRRVLPSKFEDARWKSFRGDNARSITCRQNKKENYLSWLTAPAPADAESVTFIFAGGLGFSGEPATDGFSLEINGKPILKFDRPVDEVAESVWKSDDSAVTLAFDSRRRETQDTFGLFRLTVPKALLSGSTIGETITVRSLGEGSMRWFGLNPIVDLTDN